MEPKLLMYVIFWYAMSSWENVNQKRFYVFFPYPLTVSFSHTVIKLSLLYPILTLSGHQLNVFKDCKAIGVLSLVKLSTSISSHTCNLLLTISYAQTVKSLSPLITILLARIHYNQQQTPIVYVSVLMMSIGITVATCTEIDLSVVGVFAALFMTVSSRLGTFYSKLNMHKLSLHPLVMLYKIHFIEFFILLPIWVFVDVPKIAHNKHLNTEYLAFIYCLLVEGALSFGTHWIKFQLLAIISSVSYSVLDSTKSMVKIMIGMLFDVSAHTWENALGSLLAGSGVLLYSKNKSSNKYQ